MLSNEPLQIKNNLLELKDGRYLRIIDDEVQLEIDALHQRYFGKVHCEDGDRRGDRERRTDEQRNLIDLRRRESVNMLKIVLSL